MLRKCSVVCAVLLLGAFALGTASADPITVGFVQQNSTIPTPGGTVNVDIVADIPENTAVVGWGLDLSIVNAAIANLTGAVVATPPWDAVTAPDGDGLAGLAPTPPGTGIWGNAVILATLTFTGLMEGTTAIALSNTPGDLNEGFAIDPLLGGGFATVNYVGGTVTVLPEPTSLGLLALAGLLALRRR